MYTTLDKAIVAFVVGVLGIVGILFKPLGISPETVAAVVSMATPFLVYIWPNAPKDAA